MLLCVAAGIALREILHGDDPRVAWLLCATAGLWLSGHLLLVARLVRLASRRGTTYQEAASSRGARIAYEKHAKNEVRGSYERLKEAAPPPLIITSDTAWPS